VTGYIIGYPQVQLSPQPKPEVAHRCGRCQTPWGVTNPDCPNAPIPVERFTSDDDAIWSEDD